MKTVGLKALKNNLSKYVRAAAAGEVVRITDRDRVVAELRPTEEQAETGPENPHLAKLARKGLLTPATDRSGDPPKRTHDVRLPLEQILRDLDRDREDRA